VAEPIQRQDWEHMSDAERRAAYTKFTSLSDDARREIRGKDWQQFIEHATRALDFNAEQNHVIKTDAVGDAPARAHAVRPMPALADYSDLYFFNMGGVYVHCCVPFDIFGEFMRLTGYDGPRVALEFQHEVISGLGAWSHILEGMSNEVEHIQQFRQFMRTQGIIRDPGELWAVKRYDVFIADPFAVDNRVYDTQDTSARNKPVIDLFLPSGNRFEVQPDITTEFPVRLRKVNPQPKLVRQAQIVNTITLPGRLKT